MTNRTGSQQELTGSCFLDRLSHYFLLIFFTCEINSLSCIIFACFHEQWGLENRCFLSF